LAKSKKGQACFRMLEHVFSLGTQTAGGVDNHRDPLPRDLPRQKQSTGP
jgi:hypothetical protein